MGEYPVDMSNEAVVEIFNGLPVAVQTKLEMLMASGMDSVAAFDSLTDEEQQAIEDALKGA